MLVRFAGYAIGAAVAVLTLGTLFQGGIVEYQSTAAVLLFALVLGGLMTLVKPVVQLISLPLTCITFGLFAFVINAGMFWAADALTSAVDATPAGWLLGSILTSVVGGIVFAIIDER